MTQKHIKPNRCKDCYKPLAIHNKSGRCTNCGHKWEVRKRYYKK